jgi:hypothetical protein
MQDINRCELPPDYFYYRTISSDYLSYLHSCSKNVRVIQVGKYGQFAWAKKIFGLWIIKSEKIDTPITIEQIRASGIVWHGIVIWIPWSQYLEKIDGWRSFWLPPTHNTTSGFTEIKEEREYHSLWKTRVKRALARYKKYEAAGEVKIVNATTDEFCDAFKGTYIKYWWKEVFIEYFRAMRKSNPKDTQAWVAYHGDKPVAGLAVYDYGIKKDINSSVHMVAFTREEWKPLQVGTWLMDRWFTHCQEKGIKYLNFDHLRDNPLAKDQQGYTDFKENFIEKRYKIVTTWIKFF